MLKLFKNMQKREITMAIIAFILICGQVFFDLLLPEFIDKMTVTASTPGAQIADIWFYGLQMLGCLIASIILSVLAGYLSAKIAAGFTFTIRKKLFNKVMDFGDEEMLEFGIPSLITRTTNDVTQIQTLISMGLQVAVKSPIMTVWAICKIVGRSWQLSALTAVFVAILCACVITTIVVLLPKFKFIQQITDRINLVVRENLSGINVVHAFNAEKYQNDKFEVENEKITKTQLFIQRVFAGLQPLIEACTSGLWFAIYWMGAALLIPMGITARFEFFGNIVAFALYANYILSAFMMMIMIFMMLPPALASAERINAVLDSDITIHEGDETEIVDTDKIMEYKDVFFRYPKSRENMLKNINFDIKKGEHVAIIGSTGSGKTTLVNLMLRFYDPTSGKILLHDKDIKSYTFDTVYSTISLATQKPVIFYGSIKENLNFGDSELDLLDKEIDKYIEIAQAREFVEELDEGKDTIVSQGGKDVSGGQKQRISIARAISRKPEILVLDDSFSALDYKTDANLRKQLDKHFKDTAIVMVAQRIGTIKNADKIIVLDNGKIVGMGKHADLLKTCMTYQEIAISQMKAEELAKM